MKRNFWKQGAGASGCRCAACGREIGRKIRKEDGPRYCSDCLEAASIGVKRGAAAEGRHE